MYDLGIAIDYQIGTTEEDGTSTFSGTFIRSYAIVLNSSKIKEFVDKYGEEAENDFVPSGLAPKVITSEVSDTTV